MSKENDFKFYFYLKGKTKINLQVLFRNIFKKAAFFPFEIFLTHGAIIIKIQPFICSHFINIRLYLNYGIPSLRNGNLEKST
jgi:hypothetical protein